MNSTENKLNNNTIRTNVINGELHFMLKDLGRKMHCASRGSGLSARMKTDFGEQFDLKEGRDYTDHPVPTGQMARWATLTQTRRILSRIGNSTSKKAPLARALNDELRLSKKVKK